MQKFAGNLGGAQNAEDVAMWMIADQADATDLERANAANAALLKQFYLPKEGRFRQAAHWPGVARGRQADYWLSAEALQAVLDHYALTHDPQDAKVVAAFTDGRLQGGFLQPAGDKYYDDENWMVQALARAAKLTGNQDYLDAAKALFTDIESSWDETCCGVNPGGLWWNDSDDQKATVTNAAAVITAVQLYRATGQASYLAFADKVYDFWFTHMTEATSQGDRLVYDGINTDGSLGKKPVTYDQGLMAGAAASLYKATGQGHYLDEAREFANYIMRVESVQTPYGPVMTEGRDLSHEPQSGPLNEQWRDFPQFKGITMRCLCHLYLIDRDPQLLSFLTATAHSLWSQARDPKTGLFSPVWGEKNSGVHAAVISQQSAAADALTMFAKIRQALENSP